MSRINSANTNVAALIGIHNVNRNGDRLSRSIIPLATGSRINRAADDPAGLIASENLRASLAEIDAEQRALDRDEMVANVADGALSEISDLTTDLNTARVAAANTGAMSDAEREAYQLETDSALQTIDRVAQTTRFNGQRVLDGSITISVGGDSVTLGPAGTHDIGTEFEPPYSLADLAAGRPLNEVNGDHETAQGVIAEARDDINSMRGRIGAFSRYTIDAQRRSNDVAYENTAAANSAIRDTDYASATSDRSRASTLFNASIFALRAADEHGRSVLNFLA